jgi:copper chaperone
MEVLMQFRVDRMSCEGCAKTITDAIRALDGNATVEADIAAKTVRVETSAQSDAVTRALAAVGYPATPS